MPVGVEINTGNNIFTGQDGDQRQSRDFSPLPKSRNIQAIASSDYQVPEYETTNRLMSHSPSINRVIMSDFLPPSPPTNNPNLKKIDNLIISGRKDCEVIKDNWLLFHQELVNRNGQDIALQKYLTGSDDHCCNWIGVKCGFLDSVLHLVSLEWQDEADAKTLINQVVLGELLPPPPQSDKSEFKKIDSLIISGKKDCKVIKDNWLLFNQGLVIQIGQEIALQKYLTISNDHCCNWIGVKCIFLENVLHLVSLEWQDEAVERYFPTIGYETLHLYGFKIVPTSGDGHCQFHAIAERMNTMKSFVRDFGSFSVQRLRNAVHEQLRKNPELWPVFYDDHDKERFRTFSDYLAAVQYSGKNTNLIVYGTHMTLTAILEVYPITITVYNQDTTQPITEGVDPRIAKPNINIFLAGLHYSSLAPIDD